MVTAWQMTINWTSIVFDEKNAPDEHVNAKSI